MQHPFDDWENTRILHPSIETHCGSPGTIKNPKEPKLTLNHSTLHNKGQGKPLKTKWGKNKELTLVVFNHFYK